MTSSVNKFKKKYCVGNNDIFVAILYKFLYSDTSKFKKSIFYFLRNKHYLG